MIETFVCTYSLDSGRKSKIHGNFDFQIHIMAVGVTLRDFCENTSVHGLAFVVESKSSILKRLAWMTIFLMCLSYAIMQIKESMDGRLRNSALHTFMKPSISDF